MSTENMRKAARETAKIVASNKLRKPLKKPRTLNLSDDNYDMLRVICARNHWSISEVVDELMGLFIKSTEELELAEKQILQTAQQLEMDKVVG